MHQRPTDPKTSSHLGLGQAIEVHLSQHPEVDLAVKLLEGQGLSSKSVADDLTMDAEQAP